MKKTSYLQFGWHSHVPYVLNNNNYYKENRRRACSKWIIDSVNGFTEYYKIFESVPKFASFVSISGQAVAQFAALAEMDSNLKNYLVSLNFRFSEIDELKYKARNILENTKRYAANERLELIGTGFNHPIMPFLNEDDFFGEIERTRAIYREYFGVQDIQGFFPPESCVSKRDIDLYTRSGLKYLVLEDPAYVDVEEEFTKPAHSNGYILHNEGSAQPLHCFHRNRAVSLLSWLSNYDEHAVNPHDQGHARRDIAYKKADDSVERSKAEFEHIFSNAQHQHRNLTNPHQFAKLLVSLSGSHFAQDESCKHTSLMLWTDHEYLGNAAHIFPLIHQAVRILADNNHFHEGQRLNLEFATLKQYHKLVSTEENTANIKVKQGSWCSGLMLADAYVETRHDGTHVYAHGAISEPFSNWKSFTSHYNLAKQNYDKVRAVIKREKLEDQALEDLLERIADKILVASTSCFYGWFPPVYRLIPAFELLKDVHESLEKVKAWVNYDDTDTAVHWNDDALLALNSRIQQLKLSNRMGRDGCIERVETTIAEAQSIFRLHQTDHYALAYQLLINASRELDDIFEDIDRQGQLFREPNDPWDLWRRTLVNQEYV